MRLFIVHTDSGNLDYKQRLKTKCLISPIKINKATWTKINTGPFEVHFREEYVLADNMTVIL